MQPFSKKFTVGGWPLRLALVVAMVLGGLTMFARAAAATDYPNPWGPTLSAVSVSVENGESLAVSCFAGVRKPCRIALDVRFWMCPSDVEALAQSIPAGCLKANGWRYKSQSSYPVGRVVSSGYVATYRTLTSHGPPTCVLQVNIPVQQAILAQKVECGARSYSLTVPSVPAELNTAPGVAYVHAVDRSGKDVTGASVAGSTALSVPGTAADGVTPVLWSRFGYGGSDTPDLSCVTNSQGVCPVIAPVGSTLTATIDATATMLGASESGLVTVDPSVLTLVVDSAAPLQISVKDADGIGVQIPYRLAACDANASGFTDANGASTYDASSTGVSFGGCRLILSEQDGPGHLITRTYTQALAYPSSNATSVAIPVVLPPSDVAQQIPVTLVDSLGSPLANTSVDYQDDPRVSAGSDGNGGYIDVVRPLRGLCTTDDQGVCLALGTPGNLLHFEANGNLGASGTVSLDGSTTLTMDDSTPSPSWSARIVAGTLRNTAGAGLAGAAVTLGDPSGQACADPVTTDASGAWWAIETSSCSQAFGGSLLHAGEATVAFDGSTYRFLGQIDDTDYGASSGYYDPSSIGTDLVLKPVDAGHQVVDLRNRSARAQVSAPAGTTFADASFGDPPATLPAVSQSGLGVLAYTATGLTPGAAVDVFVSTPGGSGKTALFKQVAGSFTDVSSSVTTSTDGISLHVQDGGPLDEDATVNGTVIDPVVAVGVEPTAKTQRIIAPPAPSGVITGGTIKLAFSSTGLVPTLSVDPASSDFGVCTVGTLSGGSYSIVLQGTGTCALVASQGGSREYFPAPPVRLSFTVAPADTALDLSAVPTTMTYGSENLAMFRVTVRAEVPVSSGKVTLKVGSKTLCTATVVWGSASCSPKNSKLLRVGSYMVSVTYAKTLRSSRLLPSSDSFGLTVNP